MKNKKFIILGLTIIGIILILAVYSFKIDNFEISKPIDVQNIPVVGENRKNPNQYFKKEAFIISDQNWQEVLQSIPLVVWTDKDGEINQYPFLIFHREGNNFDADSMISFINQYQPEKITIIGEIPEVLELSLKNKYDLSDGLKLKVIGVNQTNKLDITEILSYWQSFENVVYSENNYELALLASSYASLINAPLIIQNNSLDNEKVLADRNIICIGKTENQNCSEQYSLEQLRQKYLELTKTDKIILVNPNDLDIKIKESFKPKVSKGNINELYSKASLGAPILASARQELILSISSTSSEKIDEFIEKEIEKIDHPINYLTIIANPNAIPLSKLIKPGKESYYASLDPWLYANIDDDPLMDLALGRIIGLTITDVSIYIARDLFYPNSDIQKEMLFIAAFSDFGGISDEEDAFAYSQMFNLLGYKTKIRSETANSDDWRNNDIILYEGHGSGDWAGIQSYQIPSLSNSLVVLEACATCAFEKVPYKKARYKRDLFCAQVIRQGGIAFVGAVEELGDISSWNLLSRLFAYNDTLGQAYQRANNVYLNFQSNHSNLESYPLGSYSYILIGDPLIELSKTGFLPLSSLELQAEINDEKSYILKAQMMKILLTEANKSFFRQQIILSTIDQYQGYFYLRVGPFDLSYEKPKTVVSSKWPQASFTHITELGNGQQYFWIQLENLSAENLSQDNFMTVEDEIKLSD